MTTAWQEGWASDYGGEPPVGLEVPGSDRLGRAIGDIIEAAMEMAPNSVRWAGQDAPTGNVGEEFATFTFIDNEDAAIPEAVNATQEDGSELEAVTVQQYLTVSVNFFRGKAPAADDEGLPVFTTAAYDRAKRLPLRLRLTTFAELLRAANIGFIGASKARNLSGIADAHRESRGQVDLYISVIASENAPVSTFASLGSTGITVENPAGGVTTKTITP
jgi:hypothetical protein